MFDDSTTYELFGQIEGGGGLDRGGTKWAMSYATKCKAKNITVYGDEELGGDSTEWSRARRYPRSPCRSLYFKHNP